MRFLAPFFLIFGLIVFLKISEVSGKSTHEIIALCPNKNIQVFKSFISGTIIFLATLAILSFLVVQINHMVFVGATLIALTVAIYILIAISAILSGAYILTVCMYTLYYLIRKWMDKYPEVIVEDMKGSHESCS